MRPLKFKPFFILHFIITSVNVINIFIAFTLYSYANIRIDSFSFFDILKGFVNNISIFSSVFLVFYFTNIVFISSFYFYLNFIETYYSKKKKTYQRIGLFILGTVPYGLYLAFLVYLGAWRFKELNEIIITIISIILNTISIFILFKIVFRNVLKSK